MPFGNAAPTFDELTETQLKVTGTIPPELNGRYLRNGPNPRSGDSPHWFLGDGMLHGVELKGGKANWYRNRYVRTPYYASKPIDYFEDVFNLRNGLANTHVISHAGKTLALEELHLPYEVTAELDTIGIYDFNGKLNTGMTAHPKVCGETGEMLFFAYSLAPPYLTYHRVNPEGKLVQSEAIEVKGATMVHDFNITRNFVIFMDLPYVFDVDAANDGGMPFKWSADYGARLGVMPRDGTNDDVVWYDIEPCYVFHPVNAYEEGDDIMIDVCRSGNGDPFENGVTYLHRWTIDQKKGAVKEQTLDDNWIEFPRVPDRLVGQKYRYSYTAQFSEGDRISGVRKYDMDTSSSTLHDLGESRVGGEPVFVPSSNLAAEDDGYLLLYVYDESVDTSEFVILDAKNIEQEPLARVYLPARVPAGFHGSWIADAS